tara:strand:+ start:6012 stop:6437 length:426 start_codon:yes stop_codon:yes gene_type:complete
MTLTALDKALWLQSLKWPKSILETLDNRDRIKYQLALDNAINFYIELSELGYSSVRECIFKASVNKGAGRSSVNTSLVLTQTLLEISEADQPSELGPGILDDLELLKLNFSSFFQFIMCLRAPSTTITVPKSEQRPQKIFL